MGAGDLGGRSNERTLLIGALDWHRAVVVRKGKNFSIDDILREQTDGVTGE